MSGKTETEVSFGVSFLYRFGYRLGRRYFLTRLGLVKCREGNDNDINHIAAQIVKRPSIPKHSKRARVQMKCMDTSTCWHNVNQYELHVSCIGYVWGIV